MYAAVQFKALDASALPEFWLIMSSPTFRARRPSDPGTGSAQHQNRILAALPAEEFERMRPHLTPVTLELKQPFWEPDQPIEHVHFPIDLVASVLALTEEGSSVEVGTIGNEGLVGLPVFLGAPSSPGRSVTQIAGRADRIDAGTFRREARREGALRDLLQRYTLAFMTQVSQSTACNRAHRAQQRLARWILVLRDRTQSVEFPMTQEFMAQMLGVRRATVSEIAGQLQAEELISYRRGMIRLTDQPGLERRSCECYRIVRREFERLLGVPMG
jgi:CRP-like cAMP-binding protein